jgi:hypothetical protein
MARMVENGMVDYAGDYPGKNNYRTWGGGFNCPDDDYRVEEPEEEEFDETKDYVI